MQIEKRGKRNKWFYQDSGVGEVGGEAVSVAVGCFGNETKTNIAATNANQKPKVK